MTHHDHGDRAPSTDDLLVSRPQDAADDDSASAEGRGVDSHAIEDRPLLHDADASSYRERWDSIQTGFVDEPRESVSKADTLVAEVMQRLAETFSSERGALEAQWDRGADVSTEDLRVALQRYRSFFNRLLGA